MLLFAARAGSAIAPIQFALAGMNAHINYDLPVGLVDVCPELERGLLLAIGELLDWTGRL